MASLDTGHDPDPEPGAASLSASSSKPLNTFPLPGELIDAILSFLAPRDLARVCQVCRAMHVHASADRFWQAFVQDNIPGARSVAAVPLPAPLTSFRDLYIAHEPRWFLPRFKIWICGQDMAGKVVLVRYDPRRGCIEGYRLLAVSNHTTYHHWPPDANVVVHAFEPEVLLHLDHPVLKLDAHLDWSSSSSTPPEPPPGALGGGGGGPKITLYQQPTPPLWSGNPAEWAGESSSKAAERGDGGDGASSSESVCPRIKPILMDMDGDGSSSRNAENNGASSIHNSRQLHRQFVFARPLSASAERGGSTFRSNTPGAEVDRPSTRAVGGWAEWPPSDDDEEDEEDDVSLDPPLAPRRTLRVTRLLPYPLYTVWPPPVIPAPHRVRGSGISAHHYPRGPVGQPLLRSQISDRAFHVRTWMDSGHHSSSNGSIINTNTTVSRTNTHAENMRAVANMTPGELMAASRTGRLFNNASDDGDGVDANREQLSMAAVMRMAQNMGTTTPTPAVPLPDTAAGPATPPPHPPRPIITTSIPTAVAFDTVDTYATIDPVYYTPTADKPFRGIWVGDYSGHGCEFLLIHQPDDDNDDDDDEAVENDNDYNVNKKSVDPTNTILEPPRLDTETDEAYARRVRDARIYRGRLEAIKLTGDPNVPRGELTFVADDLGPGGLDCVMQDGPFAGARIVKSLGHVAGTGFRNDRYVESRLLLISPDRLAQFWVGFGHISFFERVDVDKFLDPLA